MLTIIRLDLKRGPSSRRHLFAGGHQASEGDAIPKDPESAAGGKSLAE
jgi:hypothetical protein